MTPVLLALVVGMAAMGCGTSASSPVEATTERFREPAASVARDRAPDMYAAAERAHQDALDAERRGDVRAAQDHATRARLLLQAAMAEADRLALEERRLAAEQEARAFEEQAARDVHARLALQAAMGRRASAQVAAQQAELAFERAAEDESRRYRASAAERARMHREASDVLLQRAKLYVSAAQAMGATEARTSQAKDLIEEAEAEREPARRIRRAQEAVHGAMVALGEARRASGEGPPPDQSAALQEAAGQAGFEVEQTDRGLAVRVGGVFAGRAARPGRSGRRRLEQLAAILEAHPHGPVQVHGFGSGARGRRLADARATAASEQLTRAGVAGERLAPEGVVDGGSDDTVEVVFVAYGAVQR